MKVWVYDNTETGQILFFRHTMGIYHHDLLGTLDLPIEPVKKEVVKTVEPSCEMVNYGNDIFVRQHISQWLPHDAYDIKLTYKVKE